MSRHYGDDDEEEMIDLSEDHEVKTVFVEKRMDSRASPVSAYIPISSVRGGVKRLGNNRNGGYSSNNMERPEDDSTGVTAMTCVSIAVVAVVVVGIFIAIYYFGIAPAYSSH